MEKIRIGIVDDSLFSISILRNILTDKGYEVVGDAGSLETTKQMVLDTKPNLVTMDMTLPGTDGFECTRAIHEIDPSIKVIIVSSMMDDEIIKKAKSNKAAGYVQKPVDPDELATTIDRIMAGHELKEELDAVYFSTFKEAFADNVNRFAKKEVAFKNEETSCTTHTSLGISTVISIIGKFIGRLIVDTSFDTAVEMAKVLLRRDSVTEDEAIAMLGEFANIVAGNASSMLNRRNKLYGFRVAPPTVIHGESIRICNNDLATTSVIAETPFGDIYINVGFKRSEDEWM